MKNRSRLGIEKIDQKTVTVSPPTIAVSAIMVNPEYIRLPKPGEKDPLFGLTRSYLNVLVLPSKQNDFQPPVRSSVLRQEDSQTGVRLINVASLKAYVDEQLQVPNSHRSGGDSAPPNSSVEFIRLPKIKQRDPLFGLSRSFLNELILPCRANRYNPPVQSHVLRRRGYRTGIRLISVDSLRRYIHEHEDTADENLPVGGPRIEQGDI